MTSVSATVDSNDLTLMLSSTFQAPPLYNMTCPSYFYYSHGTCGQNDGSMLSFINLAIDTQGETKFSQSPEDVENVQFQFGDDVPSQVQLRMSILQFQDDSEDCRSNADCEQYVQYLQAQDYGIDYNYDSIHCFRDQLPEFANWPIHGCAVQVEIGTSSTCFDDDIDLICDFATFFSVSLAHAATDHALISLRGSSSSVPRSLARARSIYLYLYLSPCHIYHPLFIHCMSRSHH